MSPTALSGNATEQFEDLIPAIVVFEIQADARAPFEDITPTIVNAEI
jgi:hypothetical protein